jgi:iron complex outermembrane receptor protein
VFADFEANVTEAAAGLVRVRGEHYSDLRQQPGRQAGGPLRLQPMFALRGSVQNGFRAPSPQQQNFSATSTNFINGVPFEITTFRPTDPVARGAGRQAADAENRSTCRSAA